MVSSKIKKKKSSIPFVGVVLLSIIIHLLFLGGIYALNLIIPQEHIETFDFIDTKLVRLGKPKKANELPDKIEPLAPVEPEIDIPEAAPNEPVPPVEKAVVPKEMVKPKDKPKVKPKSNKEPEPNISELLRSTKNKTKRQASQEGQEDGSKYGNVAKGEAVNAYFGQLKGCLESNAVIDSIPQKNLKGKKLLLSFKIGKGGALDNRKIIKKSGIVQFDNAGLRALKKCSGKIDPPAHLIGATKKINWNPNK